MIGNAQVYPMQYFYINNMPMFGGLYQILKVSHSITPNNMSTTIEGIRMRFSIETQKYGGVMPVTLEDLQKLGEVSQPMVVTAAGSTGTYISGGDIQTVVMGAYNKDYNPVFEKYIKLHPEYFLPNTPQEFIDKLKTIASRLNTNATWIMAIMMNESRFNPKAVNNYTDSVGLIQFMPATLKHSAYGSITPAQCYNKTALEQLDLVYTFYSYSRGKLNSLVDVGLATFWPAAAGKNRPDDYVFGISNGIDYAKKIAKQNKGLDVNKDGLITMADYKMYMYNTFVVPYKMA